MDKTLKQPLLVFANNYIAYNKICYYSIDIENVCTNICIVILAYHYRL